MDPATVQTVRIKASASLRGSGRLLVGGVSLAAFFAALGDVSGVLDQ